MKAKAGIAMIGLLALTLCAGTAWAGDRYVNPDGICGGSTPCYTTIQAAITAADPGDTVHVAVGIYNERPTVGKSLTIIGADEATVIIDAGAGASGSYGFTVTADNVSISKLTLVGDTSMSTPRYGFKISNVSNFTMTDVTGKEFYRTAVDLLGVTNGTLTDVTSIDNNGHGVSLVDCNSVTLTNTVVSGNAWQGVSVATWGRYSTLGTSGIVFLGTNSFGNLFQLEEGDYNNPGVPPAGNAIITYSTTDPLADVLVQASDFGFALHGEQDDSPDQNRVWFFDTLANAAIIPGMGGGGHWTGTDMYIESLTDGTQHHVTPGCSIQAAINAADPGDTINVSAGPYGESVSINKSVTLLGANAGVHPAVGTHPTETVGTRGAESILSNNYPAIVPSADGITIDGFMFTGDGGRIIDTYADANDFHLLNCIFDNDVTGTTQGVIQFGGGSHTDMLLAFNLFQDEGDHTFYTGGGPFDSLTIEYNKFNVAGESVFWAATPLVDGVVRGNEFDGTIGTPGVGFCTMNIGKGGNISIENNWFHDLQYTPFQIGIIGGSVVGNTIERIYPYPGYWGSAFELWGGQWGTSVSANVTITDNTVHYNDVPGAAEPSHGIRLRGPEAPDPGIDGSTINIYHNSFLNGGVRSDAYAVRHQGDPTTTADADENYWGTLAYGVIAGLMEGNADFQPWCNSDFSYCGFTGPVTDTYVDDGYVGLADGTEVDWPDGAGGGGHYIGYDAFAKIQDGIEAVSGSTVHVAEGIYVEQLYIDSSVDLVGAGIGATVLEAVALVDRTTYDVTQWTGDVRTIDACIGVNDAGTVNISGFTVDGLDLGPNNFYGIHFFNTSGSVTGCRIEDITDTANPGFSRIISLAATHGDGETISIDFSYNFIPNMQKGGILVMGPGATFTVDENNVADGPSADIAGNCIQLSYGASGSTLNNIVQGVYYTGTDWASTGILLFESGDIDMVGDEVFDCQSGVNFSDWGWVYLHPTTVNLTFTGLDLHGNDWPLGAQLSRDNSDPNITITDCDIGDSSGDGIDVWGTGLDPWGGVYYTGWDNGDLNVSISGCKISGNGYDGIWTADQSGNTNTVHSFDVYNSSFSANTGSAVNNTFPSGVINASGCWWGDASGPVQGVILRGERALAPPARPYGGELPAGGATLYTPDNSTDGRGGGGETIYGSVDYTPWMANDGAYNAPGFDGDFSELWVDDDSPQTSSQAYIEEALGLVSGSTINVAAGTYGPFILNSTVNMIGAQAGVDARGRVVGAPDPLVESVITAGSGILCELKNGCAGSVIDGFAFDGAGNAILSNGGPLDGLVIQNNHMAGASSSAVFLNDHGDDITVHQNSMDGSSMGSGGLFHLDQDTFDGFHFTSNWAVNQENGFGLFVDGNRNVGSSVARDPLFNGNLFKNNQQSMNVGKRALENAEISDNTFQDNSYDGLLGGPKDTLITKNVFLNNGRDGLILTSFGDSDPAKGAQGCTVSCNLFQGNGFVHAAEAVFFSSGQAPGTISTNILYDNNITGNNAGAYYGGTETIDAEDNWWGAADGPGGAGPGSGDGVNSLNIDFDPFLTTLSMCAPRILTLEADQECYELGETVCVEIWMHNVDRDITGGQFFLYYDTGYLTLATGDPGAIVPGDAPMDNQVYECSVAQQTGGVCTPTAGEIGYGVGVPWGSGLTVTGDWKMATICFTAAQDICSASDLMSWWMTAGSTNHLTADPFEIIEPGLMALDLDDATPPTIDPVAGDSTVECDGAGNTTELNAWLANHGGAGASDNCGSISWTHDFTTLSDDCGATGFALVTFTATDHCGNYSTTAATFTIEDTTTPAITTAASNQTVECDGAGNSADLTAWLNNLGGAAASDDCGGVTWSYTPDPATLSDLCGATGAVTVTFRATDDCGLFSETTATFTVEDTVAPVISGCPGAIEVNADAGYCSAIVTWTEPTAADVCGMGTFASTHSPGDTFPQGVTTVTYTAEDDCGNISYCTFDVTVLAFNDLIVSVEIQGIDTAVTRCIKFTFTNCTTSNSEVIYRDVGFDAAGVATNVPFDDLPCEFGPFDCVTAEDVLHTLQVRLDSAPDFGIVGTQYVADFTGVNRLTTADYYNDDLIDISDFGVMIVEWGACYDSEPDTVCDGNTPCAYTPPTGFHADANGDGTMDVSDFNPISANFLMTGDPDCCVRGDGGGDEPRDAITVQELREMGVHNARVADLNGDGWIDMTDVELFLNGNVPDDKPELAPSESTRQATKMHEVRP